MGDADSCKELCVPPFGPVHGHAFRLFPNDSIKESLQRYAELILQQYPEKECSSVFVMTAVGSLCDATLRFANASNGEESKNDIKRWENQRFEVVSLVGTFSRGGACHLHISLSDETGDTVGGHLIEGKVFTTLEVVLGTIQGVEFSREYSNSTGYRELATRQLSGLSLQSKHTSKLLSSSTTLSVMVGVCIGFLLARGYR